MAGVDIPKEAMIAALVVGGFIYLQTLKQAGGVGRGLAKAGRGVYGDVKSVYGTGYRDVAKPIGRSIKSTARGTKSKLKGAGRWLKRRF